MGSDLRIVDTSWRKCYSDAMHSNESDTLANDENGEICMRFAKFTWDRTGAHVRRGFLNERRDWLRSHA
jgi:hypothetical protein